MRAVDICNICPHCDTAADMVGDCFCLRTSRTVREQVRSLNCPEGRFAAASDDRQVRGVMRRKPKAAPPPGPQAIPASPESRTIMPRHWPIRLWPVVLLRIDSDRGVGDTLERYSQRFGGMDIAEWYTVLTGLTCNCSGRIERLNNAFPYSR